MSATRDYLLFKRAYQAAVYQPLGYIGVALLLTMATLGILSPLLVWAVVVAVRRWRQAPHLRRLMLAARQQALHEQAARQRRYWTT